jgi:hypothetical protein
VATLVVVRGTFDTFGVDGMLGGIVRNLDTSDPTKWNIHYLDYPADFGTKLSYRESREIGIDRLIEFLLNGIDSSEDIFILGYSQGAAVVTLALKNMLTAGSAVDAEILGQIKGVYLIANPHRQPDHWAGSDPGRGTRGIAFGSQNEGWWGDFKIKVFEFCEQGDIIGSVDPNTTLLHRFVYYIEDASVTNAIGWAVSIRDQLRTVNPFALFPETRKAIGILEYTRRWWNSLSQVSAYLVTGVHVDYGHMKLPSGEYVFHYIAHDMESELTE